MYNFENYLLMPMMSTFVGLILFLGIVSLGYFIINLLLNDFVTTDKKFYLNSPLIGSNFLLVILTPLAYFEKLDEHVFKTISFFLIGTFGIFLLKKSKILLKKFRLKKGYKYNFEEKLIFIVILLYFLISISPVTHADSLGYHMLGAVNFLSNLNLLSEILPSEIKLVGPGELLIALGLSLGSEQLGGIIQFSSFFTIFYCFKEIKKNISSNLILLATITTPTIILLATTQKPQLLHIANVLLCSYFLYKIYINNFSDKLIVKYVSLIILFVSINILVKFSFSLSSSIIIITLIYILFLKKKFVLFFFPAIIITLIMFIPKYIFMNKYYDVVLINFLTSSLPTNLSLYDSINSYLKQISNGSRVIPTWIMFPKNFGALSDIIGPVFFSFLLFKFIRNRVLIYVLFFYLSFFILILNFGQATSRFIYEGFVVLQMFLLITTIKFKKIFDYYKYYIYFQTIICIFILIYFVISLTPGSFTKNLRLNVMKNNANGYELMKWTNSKLKKEEQIISSHRSLSLLNNKSYSLFFLKFLDKDSKDFINYIDYLDKNNVKKILLIQDFDPGIFKSCIGEKVNSISNIKISQGRNPLKKNDFGSANIYKIKSKDLKSCIYE
tara:strand:+ start:268 stop:2103 length:1836 start_codon:yes stop_codon:yes gene_type:complete